jgi:hypothetical protein
MPLTREEYLRAWERAESRTPHLNRQLAAGSCVLETLSLVVNPAERYVFLDDFGYAISYCRQRLWEDLVPPKKRGGGEDLEKLSRRWRRMRKAFSLTYLATNWKQADAAFIELLDVYVRDGYSRALGDRLREIVNAYGFDLELGEIYALPSDLPALLAAMGDDRATFNFSNARHRAILARHLRETNKTA